MLRWQEISNFLYLKTKSLENKHIIMAEAQNLLLKLNMYGEIAHDIDHHLQFERLKGACDKGI